MRVVITAPDPEWLRDFSRQLDEDGLCASAHNFAPVRSIYRWAGKIYERTEGRASLHTPMPRFLITYYAGDMPQDPESIAQARRAFTRWATKTGAALAETGAPIRFVTTISSNGIHDRAPAGPFMGWSVIEAENGNAAARLLGDHPFISRGGILQLSEPI
jgi:CutA1 divalent ion tolerance protein